MILEQDVFRFGQSKDVFYTIENSDGKKWSLCSTDIKTSFEIYEPSSIKGRLLKKCCFLLDIGLFRKKIGIRKESISFNKDIQIFLEKYFGDDFSFSIFYGTPSTDQKLTIQLFKGKTILGYCKIGRSQRVRELFQHESELLKYLKGLNVIHIPQVCSYEEIGELVAFIQTTEKGIHSVVDHRWNHLHDDFLQHIYSCSFKKIKYENSDYYTLISSSYELLPDNDYALVQGILDKINKFYENKFVEWGAIHGDFTPWNTCRINKVMFVFDFEYGLYCAPKEIDKWHFLIQTNIFKSGCTVSKIASIIVNQLFNDIENELIGFETYILFYVFTYLKRGNEDDINQIHIRLEIYRSVIEEVQKWIK